MCLFSAKGQAGEKPAPDLAPATNAQPGHEDNTTYDRMCLCARIIQKHGVFGKGRGVFSNLLIIVIIIKMSLEGGYVPLQLTDIYRYLAPYSALE